MAVVRMSAVNLYRQMNRVTSGVKTIIPPLFTPHVLHQEDLIYVSATSAVINQAIHTRPICQGI